MAVWSIIKVSELEGTKRLDAEYYKPFYLKTYKEIKNCGIQISRLKEFCRRITDGSHITPPYIENGIRFLMVRDVLEEHINFDNNDHISESFDKKLKHCKPSFGDILLTKVGSVGIAAVVPENIPEFNIFVSLAVLKGIQGINKYYLSTFLNSRLGRIQAIRQAKGISQPDLHLEDIREFLIPKVNEDFQRRIEALIIQVHEKQSQAQALYTQAEQMTLDEIGWDKLNLSQPKWWTAPLSKGCEEHRFDAEHFQPKYDKLLEHLKKTGKAKQIRDILAEPIRKGITPEYDPHGSIVVINSQHLGRYNLNYEATDRTIEAFWKANKRAQIRQNDVMIYATGAYIGRANTYLEQARALAGVDVLLVRPTKECDPLYLAVFLNSLPGLMQSKKFSRGSGQAHIYPDDVCSYWVYTPSDTFQQKIADLVQQSHIACQKAKALLEEAKAKVEAVISGS